MHFTHYLLPEDIRPQAVRFLNKHVADAIELHGQMVVAY